MFTQRAHLLTMLIWLTILAIAAEISLFVLHFQSLDILDSVVKSSLASQFLHSAIIFPIAGFIFIQLMSYFIFIAWIWFISVSSGEFLRFSNAGTYTWGLCIWFIACCAIVSYNNYYFPDSFFASFFQQGYLNNVILIVSITLLGIITGFAYLNFSNHKILAISFLLIALTSLLFSAYHHFFLNRAQDYSSTEKPNIIFIGLDSVRPDYIHYFGNNTIKTPHIDDFLKFSAVFTNAHTPLARTFPAWMSILTSQYPKHNHARTNLADPRLIYSVDNIAKHLKSSGYQTIYGTDEKRFSNITQEYGFDAIIGPGIGVNDFLLGGLSDFPLTNILINTSLGQFLFPYNYANRAAAITYEPNSFLQLVQSGLAHRQHKPLFLAIHLCVSHWPFTWAQDGQKEDFIMADRYKSSVAAVDQQLGKLLVILKKNGLLKNSIVVLLSDHGTTVGLPGDRIIAKENYVGDPQKIKWLPLFTPSDPKINFIKLPQLNTSYGQGTDVLSLKQYHVLLAIQGFGINIKPQHINTPSSLLDISPTILAMLHLPSLATRDGISLLNSIDANRPLFLESGFTLAGMETDNIQVAKVLKQGMNFYQINPHNGLLSVNPLEEKTARANKQRAILMGDWLLARYPENIKYKLAPIPHSQQLTFAPVHIPACFILVNIKSGKWSIGPDDKLAKSAPMKELLTQFNGFYGDELR